MIASLRRRLRRFLIIGPTTTSSILCALKTTHHTFTSSSAMAERPRNAGGNVWSSAVLRGWITLRLNFRLKSYVSRQYQWTVRCGNGYTTTLPLEVFTERNFIPDFIRLKLIFNKRAKKSLFEPPFGGLSGNVRTAVCIYLVGKPAVDLLFVITELFFAISHG